MVTEQLTEGGNPVSYCLFRFYLLASEDNDITNERYSYQSQNAFTVSHKIFL